MNPTDELRVMAQRLIRKAEQVVALCESSTINILLVEDSPMDVGIIRQHLAQFPGRYTLTVATTFADAKAFIHKGGFHLVMLDWHLGNEVQSGLELAKEMHAEGTDFAFIICTAREADYRESAKNLGLGFINKLTASSRDYDSAILHALVHREHREGALRESNDG